jgi:signal transduction histidine kinase
VLPAAAVVGYLVLYLVLDAVSYVHPMRGTNITAWNPQAALAIALLTRYPRAWWLVVLSLLAAALTRASSPVPWPDIAASAMLAAGYVAIAAALRKWLGPLPVLKTRNALMLFLLLAGLGAAVNTALYVGTLAVLGFPDTSRLGLAVVRSWTGDVVSLIVSLPVVVALADAGVRAQTLAMLRSLEWWLIAACALVAAYIVFGRPAEDQFKYFYLLFLPVTWASARFGHCGAVWTAALIQALLILAVQSSPYQPFTVFELHMVLAALGATGLLLGATVDEREQAEQALRASLHAAAASDMAAALAHELNQPLTAMRTYARAAQLLAAQGGTQEAAPSAALSDVTAKLVNEVTRAGAVVRRLRDFFRQGGTELQLGRIDEIIDNVLQSQQPRACANGVEIEVVSDKGLPEVWMDRVQIEVVLRNLVANAIDAAAELPHGKVTLRCGVQGGQLVLEVLDSGPGVPAQDLPQIFESRASSKAGGMGIGLVISRSIVAAHDGRLWAQPGPGGKFFVSLPLARAERHA